MLTRAAQKLIGKKTSVPVGTASVLDWSTTPLAQDYAGHYVKIIDDVFSAEECAALIALAESDAEWTQAAVHYGTGPTQNYVDKDYRNSERILRFDKEAADKLYEKLLPYIPEIVKIEKGSEWEGVVGAKKSVKGTWTMVGYVESPYHFIQDCALTALQHQRAPKFSSLREGQLLQTAL